jgi:hypothetical protein
MNAKEVKAYIGTEHYNTFIKFMQGQTVGINADGSTDYYEGDVERFKGRLERMLEHPNAYDEDFLTQ